MSNTETNKCEHGMQMICVKCGNDFTPVPINTETNKVEWEDKFWNMCDEFYFGSSSDLKVKAHPKKVFDFISEQIKLAEQRGAKLAREEAIDECIAALPKTSYAETDDEQGYNDGVYDCKESLLNLKRKD